MALVPEFVGSAALWSWDAFALASLSAPVLVTGALASWLNADALTSFVV